MGYHLIRTMFINTERQGKRSTIPRKVYEKWQTAKGKKKDDKLGVLVYCAFSHNTQKTESSLCNQVQDRWKYTLRPCLYCKVQGKNGIERPERHLLKFLPRVLLSFQFCIHLSDPWSTIIETTIPVTFSRKKLSV